MIGHLPEFHQFIEQKHGQDFVRWWMKQNSQTVLKWIDSVKPADATGKGQVFSSTQRIPFAMVKPVPFTSQGMAILTEQASNDLAKIAQDQCVENLAHALVFGQRSSPGYLSGFIEQTGRLPNAEDRVIIHASEFEKARSEQDFDHIFARCRWVIERLEIL